MTFLLDGSSEHFDMLEAHCLQVWNSWGRAATWFEKTHGIGADDFSAGHFGPCCFTAWLILEVPLSGHAKFSLQGQQHSLAFGVPVPALAGGKTMEDSEHEEVTRSPQNGWASPSGPQKDVKSMVAAHFSIPFKIPRHLLHASHVMARGTPPLQQGDGWLDLRNAALEEVCKASGLGLALQRRLAEIGRSPFIWLVWYLPGGGKKTENLETVVATILQMGP